MTPPSECNMSHTILPVASCHIVALKLVLKPNLTPTVLTYPKPNPN